MDGANQRFMHGKAQWLADHLIVYNASRATGGANPFNQGLGTVDTELPVHDFDLRKIGGILTEAGGKAKEYELRLLTESDNKSNGTVKLRNVTGRTHAIRAYFLPWGGGRTYSGKLGTNADYFFTPTLNGCSFAYRGHGPNPSVAHSNFSNPLTQMADQNAMNADLLNKCGGAMPAHMLIKADYKRPPVGDEDYRSTVIGIRDGNSWHFYYQNYKAESLGGGKVTKTGIGLCIPIV
jgi:hypothetical protein